MKKSIKIIIISILSIAFLSISSLTIHNYIQILGLKLETTQNESKEQKKEGQTEEERIDALYLALTEKNLRTSEVILSTTRGVYIFFGTLITLLITIFGFLGIKFWIPKAFKEQSKEWVENSDKIIEITNKINIACNETNIALAWTYMSRGFTYFREYIKPKTEEYVLNLAIGATELSLNFLKKVYTKKPSENRELIMLWGLVHGNLAYYYALKKDKSKISKALAYAEEALIVGEEEDSPRLLDDYLFVIVSFQIIDEEKRKKAAQLFFNIEDRLKSEIYYADEMQPILKEYKSFFNKYQKNKN